ncbi:MAG TPA: S-layer homology domain-containing protein [Clostridia bacterium]|nr:S-layer homology domain-containing protein [Clostridia bacterium]
MKRYIALFTAVLIITSGLAGVFEVEAAATKLPFEVEKFSDVPEAHWAYEAVHYFRYLNFTEGNGGNKFGLGQSVKKSEFITMLVRVMGWELVSTENSSFSDVSKDKWYQPYVETAVAHGAILKETDSFNPDNQITRLEIAEAIVRGLGYEELAKQLKYLPSQFADVAEGAEYTNIVKDFGISNGNGGTSFLPDSTAKKEEAVAMLTRMYQRLNSNIKELHAFYAIKSYDQAGMIQDLNSVSFGWSRLEYDASSNKLSVAVSNSGNSDFFIPEGYGEPINIAKQYNKPVQLNLFASNEMKVLNPTTGERLGIVERLLTDADAQSEVIGQVIQLLNSTQVGNDAISFDGIVVDFEILRGDTNSKLYNEFLSKLKAELVKYNKKLYVAVHPKRGNGEAYYDGYDYRIIGEIADRIILMAHDYNAVNLTESEMAAGYNDTPLAPINEIYYALKAIADKNTGVADLSKVWLQISFDTAQWKKIEGKIVNQSAFRPSYSQLRDRMLKNEPGSELKMNYSEKLQSPWLTYYNDSDGTDNIIWYEDSGSILSKIALAKMFGINGVSLWRLGNIPDFEESEGSGMNLDIWQTIKEQLK